MPLPAPSRWRDTLGVVARLLGEAARETELTGICRHAAECAALAQAMRALRQKIAASQQLAAGIAARDSSEVDRQQVQVGSACRERCFLSLASDNASHTVDWLESEVNGL
jgi:hypothetical protein